MDKKKQNDDLFNRIRNELTAIMEENNSNDPKRKISYEDIMKSTPLPSLAPSKSQKNKSSIYHNPQSHRQSAGGKPITMKPTFGEKESSSSSSTRVTSCRTSATSLRNLTSDLDQIPSADFLDSQSAHSMDEEMKKMQLELAKSYELFQSIGEKFEAINFGALKTRIRDLHLNNEMGKASTIELQKTLDASFVQNRMETLATSVSEDFRRHPGEFGDIPELSTFFQTCAQLEHGLDTLKRQRTRSTDLEKRLCWATEIAYNRMEEIRNSVGNKPETNF
ncbi:uncharacterized protein LOC6563805 [Drosophila grimshawi]|uniref:GH18367 n=1 Tax=Drosophila grimshawi TaxID=7222 RepID=B4JEX1_DROGR|nr:uncharacterized protein LOC6563805 [Drosophila grimshawi]EDV93252.1 GH18367 [Drosophila grimshawi]